jgi:hypothetical protein
MSQFLNLPRELRDMAYAEILTSRRPLSTLEDTKSTFWYRPRTGLGFSLEKAPSTCANFLACNRQIYAEMTQAIERARHKGQLAARIDCIAKDKMHYFTWLAIPLVRTTASEQGSGKSTLSGVMPNWATKVLAATGHVLGSTTANPTYHRATTIEQLWIDIRLFEPSSTTVADHESPRDRLSWAVCAALKHILEHNASTKPTRDCRNTTSIDEVILNVVPQFEARAASALSDDGESLFSSESRSSPTEELLHDLVNVWNKLWAGVVYTRVGDEYQSRHYRTLLEKIKRVRICLDGETFRVRELAVELERGQAERRRIDMRIQ